MRDLFLLPINVSDGLSHNNAECVGLLLLPHLQWHFSFLNLEYIFLDAWVVFVILWKYNILNTSRFFDTTGFYGSSIAGDQELDKIGADKL